MVENCAMELCLAADAVASAVVGVQFFRVALLFALCKLMLDGFWSRYLSLEVDYSLLACLRMLLAMVLLPAPLAAYLLKVPSLLTLWAI